MTVHRSRLRSFSASGLAFLAVVGLAACSAVDPVANSSDSSESTAAAASAFWDSDEVHSISIDYDEDEYAAMIQTYLDSEEKEWITATVTIDGVTYENVGLKLKGNSTLRSLSTDADADLSSENPEDLPWLIRLDKFVDGQNHDGSTEFVVRGNNSETALNEALALELLEQTGLASEQAVAVRFSAEGSDETLRLVIENPDDEWMERVLGDGLLYKAEAGGDYSYRGDDASSYEDVFDQEGGDDDLTPLIDFLEWLNDSTDEEFAAELSAHLDVDAFATYLAFQDLVGNSDDIDGPGNNSYLYYDTETGVMTVVNWDLNLALGVSNGGGGNGGGGNGGGGGRGGGNGAGNAAGGGGMGGSNVLAERFLANDEFAALYAAAQEQLQSDLVDSGTASELLDAWTQTLLDDASDLVDATTIQEESDAIAAQLEG